MCSVLCDNCVILIYMQNQEPQNLETKWYKKGWGIFIISMLSIILISIIVVAVLFVYFLKSMDKRPSAQGQMPTIEFKDDALTNPVRLLAEKKNRPSFGNPNAKLIIVEFSDFGCPYCAQEFPIIRSITNKYKDDVLYIYRHFIDESSVPAAHASMCAHDQGKFWQLHDKLFINSESIADYNLVRALAIQSGVNINQFDQCMSSQKYIPLLQEDQADAATLNISGTPGFVINGYVAGGVIDAETWEKAIEASLEVINSAESQ